MQTVAKGIAVAWCVFFASQQAVCLAGSSEYVDELRFAELQLSAVTTDMYRYLGWVFEDKAAMKEAAQNAQADLEELKIRLVATHPPAGKAELKEILLDMTACLQRIYQDIDTKQSDAIKQEFTPFNDLHERYVQLFKAAWSEPQINDESAHPGDSFEEELRWIERPEHQEGYRRAGGLIEDRKMVEAYEALKGLERAVEDRPAAQLIRLRMLDALRMMDAEQAAGVGFADAFDANKHALDLLSAIVDSDLYLPVLYEAFYKWRTTTQEFDHGMSNWSEIPNKVYNEKRWRVIQRVKKHAAEHPRDSWAKTQLDLLWALPNIQRGGPFGNDNLIHWAMLYKGLEGEGQGGE